RGTRPTPVHERRALQRVSPWPDVDRRAQRSQPSRAFAPRSVGGGDGSRVRGTYRHTEVSNDAAPWASTALAVLSRWQCRGSLGCRQSLRPRIRTALDAGAEGRSRRVSEVAVRASAY